MSLAIILKMVLKIFISARGAFLFLAPHSSPKREAQFLNVCAISFRLVSEMGEELGHQH
jgi:hypothetical protein